MRKGKDVYCEKPLTLTIAEGQAASQGRQRHQGRSSRSAASSAPTSDSVTPASKLARSTAGSARSTTIETHIGDNPIGGPFKTSPVPDGLNWDFWLGQTPKVDYVKERCHANFRWWYEYSGGKMTDWGAHHNDIAQWALGMDDGGPIAVESEGDEPSKDPNSYNCHPHFKVTYTYPSGAKVICSSRGENGVRMEGEDGKWIFVSRGLIEASDQAARPKRGRGGRRGGPSKILDEPLSKDATRLYVSANHMRNFLDGVRTRKPCICPASIGHHSVTVCHIGVICLRLGGKKLRFDPVKQKFNNEEANRMLSREMRRRMETADASRHQWTALIDEQLAAFAVRGRYLPGQRAGRAEAQQDQLGRAHPPSAQRIAGHRRGEPVAAREPGTGARAGCDSAAYLEAREPLQPPRR